MIDILLNDSGDIRLNDYGDISLTDSVRQAVKTRLLWFFNEWKYAPDYGLPYLDEILVKNPNIERVKRIVKDEALTVDGVLDVRNVSIVTDANSRTAKIQMDISISDDTYREEVLIIA